MSSWSSRISEFLSKDVRCSLSLAIENKLSLQIAYEWVLGEAVSDVIGIPLNFTYSSIQNTRNRIWSIVRKSQVFYKYTLGAPVSWYCVIHDDETSIADIAFRSGCAIVTRENISI